MRLLPKRSSVIHVLIPLSFVAVWLVVGAIGGPTFGKLSSVAKNDEGSFLPASADSTKVQTLEAGFIHSQKIPALVVVESNHLLTAHDMQQLATLPAQLAKVKGVGNQPDSILGPIPASDHKAAEYV